MLRMEIALFLILAFVAYIYFSAEKKYTQLHKTFSVLLVVMLFHLVLDGITVYTVNHLKTVPVLLNDIFHRFFIGTMIVVFFLFYQYIAILVEEETGKPRRLDLVARVYLVIAELGDMLIPIHYAVTPQGNYSDGIHVTFCYLSVAFYFLLCAGLLLANWKHIQQKRKMAIGIALLIELVVTSLQGPRHTWLITGMGLTLMCMAVYLTLENPDLLRGELTEQRLSMLYFKSQINPHFLYNTLDTIRIQAQLNNDPEVAGLLMRLVDFFRLTVKINGQQVPLEDELELLESYLELICCRYPEIRCRYDIDSSLEDALVPNFILQPMVENSVLHGLKNRGYRGTILIRAQRADREKMILEIEDDGAGFPGDGMEVMNRKLEEYARQPLKLEGNSIGILNVQKRIKLLCGREYGLHYRKNDLGGTTARLLLPIQREEGLK